MEFSSFFFLFHNLFLASEEHVPISTWAGGQNQRLCHRDERTQKKPPASSHPTWVWLFLDSEPKGEAVMFLVGVRRQQPLELLATNSKYSWSNQSC